MRKFDLEAAKRGDVVQVKSLEGWVDAHFVGVDITGKLAVIEYKNIFVYPISGCDEICMKPKQRDELVRKYIVEQEAPELSDEEDRQAFELVFGGGNLKCKSLERSGEGYKLMGTHQAWKWWKAALLSCK